MTFNVAHAEDSAEVETPKKESILVELSDKLTSKQKDFIIEYVKNGGIPSDAAIAAGYSEKVAPQAAYKLLRKDEIAYEVDRIKRIQCERAEEKLNLGFQERIKNILEVREIAFEKDDDGKRPNLSVAHKSNELIAKIFEDVDGSNASKNNSQNVQINLSSLRLVDEYKSDY